MTSYKDLLFEKAAVKIKRFCAYQERSHQEVRDKLRSLGITREEAERLLSQLIEEGYLNEERFAIQFAGGKFRIKQWGKRKIVQALKERKISPYCIKKSLQQIDEADYLKTLQNLAERKWEQLKGERETLVKKRKLQNYLLQKGFEYDLIRDELIRLRE
ncbi:MAG: RecX family transcriptional regulator [Chitinophagaceae bacterium]|nr:RecX family transcriptional regulator [Chitinophagaceae bacterium]